MEKKKVEELKSKGYSILNLKGNIEKFNEVKEGKTNLVNKDITFKTQPKFLTLDKDGEVVPRKYDFLNLICGKESILVAVEKAEWFVVTDDEDNAITHTEEYDGKEVTWTECLIQYTIKVIN